MKIVNEMLALFKRKPNADEIRQATLREEEQKDREEAEKYLRFRQELEAEKETEMRNPIRKEAEHIFQLIVAVEEAMQKREIEFNDIDTWGNVQASGIFYKNFCLSDPINAKKRLESLDQDIKAFEQEMEKRKCLTSRVSAATHALEERVKANLKI